MWVETKAALDVVEVTTGEALARLEPDWHRLWARCANATPFQSPEWLIPWWEHLGGGTLWVVALQAQDRLAGLAPFFVPPRPGDAGTRELLLLGTGVTDYLDVLIEPGSEAAGVAALFQWLSCRRERWDVCDWQQLRPGSPLLETPAPVEWEEELAVQEVCPVLVLPDRVEEFIRHGPVRLWENARYCRRRAERLGAVRIERADGGNFEELCEAWLRLHRVRWEGRGAAGALADPAVQRFHRAAGAALLARGVLRLYGLRLKGEFIACAYVLQHARRAYYYLGGFNPEFAGLSPGTLLVQHAIESAIAEGAETFDFLRGGESYKYRWGAQDRSNYRRRLRAKSRAGGAG